ncbi:MAG TPA: Uma2 family endonuclease, partial [Allocoleopsis sp.]
TENYKRFPSIIIEILSPSTEAFDRGDKFSDYQQIPTLQEYVLISTKKPKIEIFKRHEKGLWILQSYTSEQVNYELESINFQGLITDLYEDVNF